jgi:hypothetical protein
VRSFTSCFRCEVLAHIQKIAPDPQQAELPLGARAPPTQALLI